MLRYYNMSIQNQVPAPYGNLNKFIINILINVFILYVYTHECVCAHAHIHSYYVKNTKRMTWTM